MVSPHKWALTTKLVKTLTHDMKTTCRLFFWICIFDMNRYVTKSYTMNNLIYHGFATQIGSNRLTLTNPIFMSFINPIFTKSLNELYATIVKKRLIIASSSVSINLIFNKSGVATEEIKFWYCFNKHIHYNLLRYLIWPPVAFPHISIYQYTWILILT